MYLTKCLLSRVSNHFNLILFSLNLKFSTAYLSSNFLLETLFDQFSLFKIFTLCGFLREALTLCPKPFPFMMGWKKFWRSISKLWKKFSSDNSSIFWLIQWLIFINIKINNTSYELNSFTNNFTPLYLSFISSIAFGYCIVLHTTNSGPTVGSMVSIIALRN